MHALPRRLREGRQADGERRMERAAAAGAFARHERRLDLRPRPGRAEPDPLRADPFPGGCAVTSRLILGLLIGAGFALAAQADNGHHAASPYTGQEARAISSLSAGDVSDLLAGK